MNTETLLASARAACRAPLFLAVLLAASALGAAAMDEALPERIGVGEFSKGAGAIPAGWQPLEFKDIRRHTEYSLVRDGDTWVVRAVSQASASGLVYPIKVDLHQYPVLRWRWKVQNVLEKGDLTRRSGDDYAARIYVAFAYDPRSMSFMDRLMHRIARLRYGDIPGRTLNYIWANREPRDKVHANPSPFSDFSRLLVCRSAADGLATWFEEERNLYEDYKLAFGSEPPLLVGIGIMTDSDNTGESAVAYYGDITFLRNASAPLRNASPVERFHVSTGRTWTAAEIPTEDGKARQNHPRPQ